MLTFSLSSNLSSPTALNGATLIGGSQKYYIVFTDLVTPKTPMHFGLDGVFQTRNESQQPYMYLGDGVGATFTDGVHTIQVKDSTGLIIDSATFTVGSTTPPTTKEQVKITANYDKIEIVTVHDPNL